MPNKIRSKLGNEKIRRSENLTRVTFDIPAPLKKAFKVKIANHDMKAKEVICKLIQAYVDNKIDINEVKNGDS